MADEINDLMNREGVMEFLTSTKDVVNKTVIENNLIPRNS